MRKALFTAFLALANLCAVCALDLEFKLEPIVMIPLEEYMGIAPGVIAQGGVDLFNIVTVGAEGGYLYEKPEGSESINTVFGGANIGAYYYPLSRLYVGAGGSIGFALYNSQVKKAATDETKEDVYEKKSFSDIYYRGFGELGFRINPSLVVSAIGGYASFNSGGSESFISGPFAGLSMRLNTQIGNKAQRSGLSASVVQDTVVYPVYSSVYSNEPFGTITIRNNEGAELRNVHVSFRATKYTSGAKLCGNVSRISRHEKISFPLCADFSEDLLNYTENGKFSGEVVIEYDLLGKHMTVVEPVIISVYNRNAFTWGDSASLAAFISPDSQEIAEFAKGVAGITRNNLYTGMNANLQYAAGIIEGLRLIGMGYSGDTSSPYQYYHTSGELDSIQFPTQTLSWKYGDYDELGILVCSCLQTINVPTGYAPLEDDFIVLVKLGIRANQALDHFASTSGLLIDEEGDAVYLPLSMAALEKGFTESYKAGFAALEKCFADEEGDYEFIDTTDAWSIYKPIAFNTNSAVPSVKQDLLIVNTSKAIKDYIASDIEKVITRARNAGDTNKLGVALVRAGRYTEAKREFQKSSSISAMNNTANILMIEKNYTAAAAQYRAVLSKDPDNAVAKKGLENANAKIE